MASASKTAPRFHRTPRQNAFTEGLHQNAFDFADNYLLMAAAICRILSGSAVVSNAAT